MKTLQDYTKAKTSELFDSTGAFFAFSTDQFNESKQEGTVYVNCGHGLVCPKGQEKLLLDGLDSIGEAGIKEDIAENGLNAIIRRELFNYECFYQGDYSDALANLQSYNVTEEQVSKVYYTELPNADL